MDNKKCASKMNLQKDHFRELADCPEELDVRRLSLGEKDTRALRKQSGTSAVKCLVRPAASADGHSDAEGGIQPEGQGLTDKYVNVIGWIL